MDSGKLKEILGKTDTEFASRVKSVLMKLGWISPEMKAALKELMGKLAKGKIVPKEDSPRFMELGDYAVKALDAELRKDPKQLIREKILEILGYMGNVGILSAVSPLLYAVSDPEPAVRLQALLALAKTAEDDKNFKQLDAMLVKAGAYQVLANHLSGDGDARVRLRAATVLGWMEVREAASLLMKAIGDKTESVGSESVWALQMISRVEVKEGESWSRQVENLKAWWAKKSKSLPKQLKPAKPFIRAKKKGTKKGK
jgi:HEAT repeat protein